MLNKDFLVSVCQYCSVLFSYMYLTWLICELVGLEYFVLWQTSLSAIFLNVKWQPVWFGYVSCVAIT